jgi:hypothetical protein
MPSLEECIERADQLAQDVVNAWGSNVSAGNAAMLTTDFKALFEVTCRYRTAKEIADNRRQFNHLNEREAAEEVSARETFARAYKDFSDKHQPSMPPPSVRANSD